MQAGVSCRLGQALLKIPKSKLQVCFHQLCNIKNAVRRGKACTCDDGFSGHIKWHNATRQWKGSCKAAQYLEGVNRLDFFFAFQKDVGTCLVQRLEDCHHSLFFSAARCDIANSNQLPGTECQCGDGFEGKITWNGPNAEGACLPASCEVPNSNKEPGKNCSCKHAFAARLHSFSR